MKRVLVLHGLSSHMRQTTFEFAMSFRRYAPSDCQVQYHNIRNPELPASLSEPQSRKPGDAHQPRHDQLG